MTCRPASRPRPARPLVKLGDASAKLGAQDVVHLQEAGTAWEPRPVAEPAGHGGDDPAARLLLGPDRPRRPQRRARASTLTKCREWADPLATVDPSNHKAVIRKPSRRSASGCSRVPCRSRRSTAASGRWRRSRRRTPAMPNCGCGSRTRRSARCRNSIDNGLSAQNVFDDLTAQWDKLAKEQPKNRGDPVPRVPGVQPALRGPCAPRTTPRTTATDAGPANRSPPPSRWPPTRTSCTTMSPRARLPLGPAAG